MIQGMPRGLVTPESSSSGQCQKLFPHGHVSFFSALLCTQFFFFSSALGAFGFECVQQVMGRIKNALHRFIERLLVHMTGLLHAREFAHKLKRRGAHFFLGGGRVKVEQGFDISTHGKPTFSERRKIVTFDSLRLSFFKFPAHTG
jgi:hypothetical protein